MAKFPVRVSLKRVDTLPRPGWFQVFYDIHWPRTTEREYHITVEAKDELGAVVDWKAWARAKKYLIGEPDDEETA